MKTTFENREYAEGELVKEIGGYLNEAALAGEAMHDAFALATVEAGGQPHVRTITLQVCEDSHLIFYVNSRSGKGAQLEKQPLVSCCALLKIIGTQICIDGEAVPLASEDADRYWAKRDRDSQLMAHLSTQAEGEGRDLRSLSRDLKKEFSFDAVPRPDHWHGYRINMTRLLIWPTGWHRGCHRHEFVLSAQGSYQYAALEP